MEGKPERDRDPRKAKFWIYERVTRPDFYGIYELETARVEGYRSFENCFELVPEKEQTQLRI